METKTYCGDYVAPEINVGATKPEDKGDYYVWGTTETLYSSLDPLEWKTGKEGGYDWVNAPFNGGKGSPDEDAWAAAKSGAIDSYNNLLPHLGHTENGVTRGGDDRSRGRSVRPVLSE